MTTICIGGVCIPVYEVLPLLLAVVYACYNWLKEKLAPSSQTRASPNSSHPVDVSPKRSSSSQTDQSMSSGQVDTTIKQRIVKGDASAPAT